jgi:hypothetical protein
MMLRGGLIHRAANFLAPTEEQSCPMSVSSGIRTGSLRGMRGFYPRSPSTSSVIESQSTVYFPSRERRRRGLTPPRRIASNFDGMVDAYGVALAGWQAPNCAAPLDLKHSTSMQRGIRSR